MKAPHFLTVAVLLIGAAWGRSADEVAPPPQPVPAPPAAPPQPAPTPPASLPPASEPPQRPLPIQVHYDDLWSKSDGYDDDVVSRGCPPGDFWLHAEYLLWFIKGDPLPPIISAGPPGSGAVGGQPGVVSLFGGTANQNNYSGGRFYGGLWLNSHQTLGVEGGYFFLSERSIKTTVGSSGQGNEPDIGRPFLNAVTGQPTALAVASAGLDFGYATASANTELQGADFTGVWNVCRNRHFALDLLGGLRYQEVGDQLTVTDAATLFILPGVASISADQFSVRNHFYGGELGARARFCFGSLVVMVTEKVALGGNFPDISIVGSTFQVSPAGIGISVGGGVLAQPSNTGNHSADAFSVVDETTIQLGWQFNDFLQGFVGYSLLYASAVVRPGNVIDTTVDPNLGAVGPLRPAFMPHQSDFWAHGVNVGLELRF